MGGEVGGEQGEVDGEIFGGEDDEDDAGDLERWVGGDEIRVRSESMGSNYGDV